MKRHDLLFILLLSIAFAFPLISAHQPRYVMDTNLSINSVPPYQIINPEISQAFYAELKGEPDYYLLISNTSFNFYLQLLSPYPNGFKDFDAAIYKIENNSIDLVSLVDGANYNWSIFYEEFAGDNYWQGPEFEKQVEAGVYVINVSNA